MTPTNAATSRHLTTEVPTGSRRRERPRSSRDLPTSCAARRHGHRPSWSVRTSAHPTPSPGSRCGCAPRRRRWRGTPADRTPWPSARSLCRSMRNRRVRRSSSIGPITCGPATSRSSVGGLSVVRSPADRADPGDQLAEAERFGDVVIGAELEAQDPIELLAPRRQHDDRSRRSLPQLATDVAAVHVGQAEVQQHHLVAAFGERSGTGGRHVRPCARQLSDLPPTSRQWLCRPRPAAASPGTL